MYAYAIDTSGISVLWTAYKFTDKLGVSGAFDDFKLTLVNKAESIEALLINSKIAIYTESVNSNSEIRDPKLRASFFKVFNTDTITGTIREIKDGKGRLYLGMNAIIKPIYCSYLVKNDTLILSTKIDLEHWEVKQQCNL